MGLSLRGNCRARLELNQYNLVLNWKVTVSWQVKLFRPERTEMNKPMFLWFESSCQRDDLLVSKHYSWSLTERVACSIFPENIQNFNSLLTWHHSLQQAFRSLPGVGLGTGGARAAKVTASNAETYNSHVSNYCWYDTFTVLCNIWRILPYRVMIIYICRIHCQVKNNFFVCENTCTWIIKAYSTLWLRNASVMATAQELLHTWKWSASPAKSVCIQTSFWALLLSCQQHLFLWLDGNPWPSQNHFWM